METSTLAARGPTAPVRPWPLALASCALALLILLPGCKPADAPDAAPEPIRPVRVVTVEERPGGETVTLTGTVQAQEDVALAFRIGGQLVERSVNIGDQVSAGQIVGRLDPSTWSDAVQAARANRAAAMARLVEARNQVERFEPLLPRGFVSRQMFDQAVEARNAAQAMVDAAEAQVSTAETQLSYTDLLADGPGVVVFRHATHVALAENNCLACHNPPDPVFKILRPVRHTSHEEMEAGKTCGACHDDKKAFGTTNTDNCQNCHMEAGAEAAPRTGPKDVALALNEGSPGAVTFRHSSHGGAQAKCARCHPSLFPMKASGKPMDYAAMLEGATCGTCHNGKEAFGVDDSAYCERCHATEGSTP